MNERSLVAGIVWFLGVLAAPAASAQPPVTALAFSPAGDSLVSGSQDAIAIRTWPSLAKAALHNVEIGQIQDIQFSPDGTQLLIAGGNPSEFGEWRIVGWPDLNLVASSRQHNDVIHSVAWQSNEQFVTAAADHEVIQWNVDRQQRPEHRVELRRRLIGHSRPVLCLEAFPEDGLITSAGVDQSIRVWGSEENASKPLRILDNHTGIVRDLARRPGDHAIPILASAGADRTVRLWQPTIGRLVRFARLPVEPLALAWSADGKQLGVACIDGKLRIVDASTVQIEQTLDAIDGWAYALVASRDGSFAIAGSDGVAVRIVPNSRLK